ncbi:hypothetical protein ASE70_15125 [Sphingomonas sp. Leaf22]|uniref:sialate O-acetylesterase n=1 Tax=Sphingomonas sp. Leaf22 TaxID=1735687 RepID=UPI0006F965E1|nr:sialate O-acetylesterase [Sphingomonas sp. Leaf22]KQM92244.1 hypothetical protein ASE70_15125 [Sphingomonas sp. Leaf22]
MKKVLFFPPAHVSPQPILLDMPDTAADALVAAGAGAFPIQMPTGQVSVIPAPTPAPTPTPGPTLPNAYLMIARGQSNTVGRGTINSTLDTEQTNIRQFCDIPSRTSTYRTIRTSALPLYHPENRVGDNNLSPVNYAAKILAATLPAGDIVLIVPTAWGGTSLLNADSNSAPNAPQWSVGRSLHENSIAQANAAVAAATAAGFTPVVHSIIDVQGEADNRDTTPTDYATALTAAINDMRTRITGGSGARLILGGFLPEKLAVLPTLQGIEDARKSVAATIGNGVFVRGASSYVLADGLDVHFDAAGTRINGRNMGAAVAQIAITPTVTFRSDLTVAEGTGTTTNIAVPVSRSTYSGAASIPITLTLGTMTADDFPGGAVPTGLAANFADGSDATTVTLTINADSAVESTETSTLTLNPGPGYAVGVKGSATVTVTNDDAGGTPPATYLNATFDAADGTALTAYTSESGHRFVGGSYTISNSETYTNSSGETLSTCDWVSPTGAYGVRAGFRYLTSTASQQIRWRVQDANNFYFAGIDNSTNTWGLYKRLNGTLTRIGTQVQPATPLAAGDLATLEIRHAADGTITASVNGASIMTEPVIDNSFASGSVGLRQNNAMTSTTGKHITDLQTFAL